MSRRSTSLIPTGGLGFPAGLCCASLKQAGAEQEQQRRPVPNLPVVLILVVILGIYVWPLLGNALGLIL
ncbi:MAG: hypothetical protein QGF90_04145 [Gammaproteobacteria bacterium]|nr:hypothetical protein [Gammaproteobacteria bacterium]